MKSKGVSWLKLVTRKNSLAFMYAVAQQKPYFKKYIDYAVGYFWHNGITYETAYSKDEVLGLGKKVAEEINKDFVFAENNAKTCQKLCDKLTAKAEELGKLEYNNLSNSQLYKILEDFLKLFNQLIPFLLFPHSIERYILGQVEEQVAKKVRNKKLQKGYMEILTSPTFGDIIQSETVLKLANYVKKNGWNRKAAGLLKEYSESYRWIPMWGLTIEPLTDEYFREEIKTLIEKVKHPLEEIARLKKEISLRNEKLEKILNKLKAGKELRGLVSTLQSYIYLRTYRKNAFSKANYLHLPLLLEVASKMKISDEAIKHLTYEEILEFLKNGKMVSKSTLKKRFEAWAVLGWDGKACVFSGKRGVQSAIRKYRIVFEEREKTDVVQGRVASKGTAKGEVKVVKSIKEISKVKNGDVLVAVMTTPDYVVAMRKCVAIVTDEGGITSHAAIVSREFGIPCVVGTGNATQVLKDGELVEVDAEKGVVTRLK